ncbi:MAG TPA: hypothetical protein VLJ39_13830, partial [Tepidisphaeraceae bacterium]|nr:hypothetical protein [Tepidisphaeraceae bacterium]
MRSASLILLLTCSALAGPTTAPTSAPALHSRAEHLRVQELSGKASDLIARHKFPEAEKCLNDAIAIIPDDTTCLYDLAVVYAVTRRPDDALNLLLRATDAGFTDFTQIESNPAFNSLWDLPRFQDLLGRKDQIRHHAAERIEEDLKRRFGEHYLYRIDEPHKLVFAAHVEQTALDEMVKMLQTEERSQAEEIFSHLRDEFLRVIVASPVDFAKREQRYGVAGRYDDSTRTLLVKSAGAELRHEFTHAIHAADQHALGQEHPVWLSEGLATLYENPSAGADDRMIPGDNWRLARVQAAARHDTLIPLDKLLKMNREEFTSRAELAYGEAGSLLLYLYEHQLLKKFYDAYTAGYAKDSTGRDA